MGLYDLHTHTTMSDGSVELDTLVERERCIGNVLGVSDHFFVCGIYTQKQIASYFKMLEPYPVYRGAEVNMEHNFALPEELNRRLDYVIASVHNMPDGRGGFIPLGEYFGKRSGGRKEYRKNYASDLCECYLTNILRMTEKTFSTQRVDIYGHSTVLPAYDELAGSSFIFDWENEVLSLCKRYGVALEISGLWHAPNIPMLQRAKKMGLTFSSGSDCHTFSQVGVLDYVRQATEQAGLKENDFFHPQRVL